jgi:hypothetical protein
MVRFRHLVAAGCCLAGSVEALLQAPYSAGRDISLRRAGHAEGRYHALRGGGEEPAQPTDRMEEMVRSSEEAAKNPPLPPLAETTIRVIETWWLAAMIWLVNLELLHRGGLRQVLSVVWLVANISLRVAKWTWFAVLGSWISSKARQAVRQRVRPPVSSVTLSYPPLSIASVSTDKYVVGGGGGRAAPGLANRVTMLHRQGDQLVLKQQESFESRVEAVHVDDSKENTNIFVHDGRSVVELQPDELNRASTAEFPDGVSPPLEPDGGEVLALSTNGEWMAASQGSRVMLFRRQLQVSNAKFAVPETRTPKF